jgi:hypothetical protein
MMQARLVIRKPDWLGTRTINCYISLSEPAGHVVKGEFVPNQNSQKDSTEFRSRIAELIREYGGVATIIDSYSVAAYWSVTENVPELHEQVLRFGIELKKLVNNRSNHSSGRRKVAIVISSEKDNQSLLELSKACLIKSYELILTQRAYEQVQKSVKAIPIGLLRPSSKSAQGISIYLFQDTIPLSKEEAVDLVEPQSESSIRRDYEIRSENGYNGGEIEIRGKYRMVLSHTQSDSMKEFVLLPYH